MVTTIRRGGSALIDEAAHMLTVGDETEAVAIAITDAVQLDTHIALWLDSGNQRLHQSTRLLIDESRRNGGTVFLSTVTAWEIALPVDTGRVGLDVPVEAWVKRFVDRPGVEAVPQRHKAASRAYQLHHLEHRDAADRLLIATAIELACPFITYDERILRFGQKHGPQYGLAIAA